MATIPGKSPSPDIHQRRLLGQSGHLWTLEIVFQDQGVVDIIRNRNLTDREMLLKRENMFRYGFPVIKEPGHWKIIHPMDFVTVDLYRQSDYFEE